MEKLVAEFTEHFSPLANSWGDLLSGNWWQDSHWEHSPLLIAVSSQTGNQLQVSLIKKNRSLRSATVICPSYSRPQVIRSAASEATKNSWISPIMDYNKLTREKRQKGFTIP
jgi:hypothetical protein